MGELTQKVVLHEKASSRIFRRAGLLINAIKQRVSIVDEHTNYDNLLQRMDDIVSDIKLHLSKLVMSNPRDVATRCQIMKRYQEDGRRFNELSNAMSLLNNDNDLRAFGAPLACSEEDCQDSIDDIASTRAAGNSMRSEIGSNKQLYIKWEEAKLGIAELVNILENISHPL